MSNYSVWFSVTTLALLVVTAGCGFTIHFGGESFRNAIKGHMVLAVITMVIGLITTINLFLS
jgi:hypothetical protein